MFDIGGLLKTFIYLISSSLLYPVLLLLVLLTLLIIIYAGTIFSEWLERLRLARQGRMNIADLLRLDEAARATGLSMNVNRYLYHLKPLLSGARPKNGELDLSAELAVENLLQDYSRRLWKSMDRFRILVRAAPSLGLIGTLIPMGTGLAALGQGDMTRLTTDLVIAFTTTVVGLAVGTTAFFFYTIRRRWIEEDVTQMELLTELIIEQAVVPVQVAVVSQNLDNLHSAHGTEEKAAQQSRGGYGDALSATASH